MSEHLLFELVQLHFTFKSIADNTVLFLQVRCVAGNEAADAAAESGDIITQAPARIRARTLTKTYSNLSELSTSSPTEVALVESCHTGMLEVLFSTSRKESDGLTLTVQKFYFDEQLWVKNPLFEKQLWVQNPLFDEQL